MENFEKKADAAFKAAQKALKTSLFKWEKDYLSAASHIDEAIKFYKLAKKYVQQKQALILSIEINKYLNDSWAVARKYEELILVQMDFIQNQNEDELMNYTKEAGIYFLQAESNSNKVTLYQKVAKHFEKNNQAQQAIELLNNALQEILSEKHYAKIEVLNQLVSILISQHKFFEAIKLYKAIIDSEIQQGNYDSVHQLILITIILYIIVGENIVGDKFLQDNMNIIGISFLQTNECRVAENLLDSYKNGDQQSFDKLIMSPVVSSIFPQIIVKEAKNIKVVKINILANQENEQSIDEEQQQGQIDKLNDLIC